MREDVEHDGLVDDALLGTSDLVSAHVDVVSDFSREVEELLAWDLLEDRPWLRVLVLQVVQTQLQRPSGDDALSTEINASNILPLHEGGSRAQQ